MRSLRQEVLKTIQKDGKMAFLSGPRQVGKTTFARDLLKEAASDVGYFNWDIEDDRRLLTSHPTDFWLRRNSAANMSRIVLDEIHKYPRWKRFLKGFFDANKGKVETMVTGSGRLDVYQKGGDSLFGRYHLFHLDPYSVGELNRLDTASLSPETCLASVLNATHPDSAGNFERLWHANGFPEPLFSIDQRTLVQWKNDHRQLILREDLRDLTRIRELGLLESMVYLLPERVGSPLSLNALREDLNVNFLTVQNWITALERLFYLFTLKPYATRLARALRLQSKTYFYDWSELNDEGKRFENLIALHLLKACHYWTDAGYGNYELAYVRDKEKREVDFLVTNERKPFLLVEAKLSGRDFDKSLFYFRERLKPAFSFQVVKDLPADYLFKDPEGPILCSAPRFLGGMP